MKRGDIYYIKSHGSEIGFEQRGDRPAVIVSNDACNAHSGCLEVVYMTTKPKKSLPTHVLVREDTARPSTVLCEQITSVDVGRFTDYMGTLTAEEMREVDTALAVSLGLPLLSPFEEDPLATAAEEDDEFLEDDEDGWPLTVTRLQAERDLYEKLYADLLEKLTR